MAYGPFLSLCLSFLVLFQGCFAQEELQQQRELRAKTKCRIESLTAQEPNLRLESEAGVSEFWDRNDKQFVCAGVEAVRNVVQPKGLLLPHYNNVPQLIYIVQGRGIQGTVMPGCAETYESGESKSTGGDRKQRFVDRHQKIQRFQEGDILALPAGVASWFYNDGEVPVVSVSLLDTGNRANQLDNNLRNFFLAGNPRPEGRGQQEQEGHSQQKEKEGRGQQEQEAGHGQEQRGQQQYSSGNIFKGFDDEILADVFNVETETIRKLRGENDRRGRIVRAERLYVIAPQREEQEQQQDGNGLEETVCSMKLRENIGNPQKAHVYNPRGGRISTLDSLRLPVLNSLQLSAERGVLYKNAILAPHWSQLAHTIVYVTRGSGRLQVVGNNGRSVFDDTVREGQLIIIPQNFASIKKAGQEGLEWVAFKTNEFTSNIQLAGRVSAIRAMPEEVLMNSYEISREDARSLKYNRNEFAVFSPGSRSPRD